MLKWLISKWYRCSPKCFCGYAMQPINMRERYEPMDGRWKCIFTKSCGWIAWQTTNGVIHWCK